jgi:signal transduction histidine kinase
MCLKRILKLKNTLLFRLTLLHALAFICLLLITFIVFYLRLYFVALDQEKKDLIKKADWYSAEMAEKGLQAVKATLAHETEDGELGEEFFRLITRSGHILFSTDMARWGGIEKHDILTKAQIGDNGRILQKISIPGRDSNALILSTVIGRGAILQIGTSLSEMQDYLGIFRNLFFALLFILMGTSAVVSWFMTRRTLAEMHHISKTADRIASGDYGKRVEIEGRPEEIRLVGKTFNRMLDHIGALIESMKEINDNIAHELRSPLARIRGIAELTLFGEKSIKDFKNMAVSTMEECDSLIEMINTMLDITEAEASVNGSKFQEFDLVGLISSACELFRPIADENEIEMKVSLPETLAFLGDRKKMQRIVTNLLENAIKYTTKGGSVSVSAEAHDNHIDILFKDTGIGISEHDLPHIFDRFYRCDRSRSQGGAGLGLSLAKAYSELMNGSIHINSIINHGSIFTLSFIQ